MQCPLFYSLLLFLPQAFTYKVALFTPAISNSQVMFNKRVGETLVDAGHDVTMIMIQMFQGFDDSMIKIDSRIKKYTIESASGEYTMKEIERLQGQSAFKDLSMWDPQMRAQLSNMTKLFVGTCRYAVRDQSFMKWLKEEKFDIAFTHIYNTCPIGLIHAAEIPSWIWLGSGMLMDYVANSIGVPTIPSYVPPVVMAAHDRMNFVQRCKSVVGHTLFAILWPRMIPASETQVFREELDPNFPDIAELAKSAPLVMVNSNDLYELPRPTLAKVINIGGLGVQMKDAKPLTGIFGEIAAKGKKMIIMSFGSVAPAHLMPESWKEGLLAAFKRHSDIEFFLRYVEDDMNDRLPPNVHLSKWLPQADLLQHKNTVAFISHGGYNSLQEVITAGKPLITIALFGDQPKNAKIAAKHGIAINLEKSQVTEEDVYNAIKEITENKKYSESALRLHRMVQKQPISASELLVRWTEFTAEFKTLENLVPAGQHLNFIQYHSIDVYSFIISIILTVIFVIFVVLRFFFRRIKAFFCGSCGKTKKE